MTDPRRALIFAGASLAIMVCAPAHADLKLCNRMSYVVETAIAMEDRGAAATRGWFRLDPGQCRNVLQGNLPPGQLYLHARVPALYGPSPLPQDGHADFCVATENFVIATARNCRAGHKPARFTAVNPLESEQGVSVTLAEEAGYTDEQARDAGLQRLLNVAGYDAGAIDGVRGDKTDSALRLFLQDHKLGVTAAARADFFDILLDAAQKPGYGGFAWCNDTAHPVMAAIGFEEKNAVTTRGWYRVEPGKCVRPEIIGQPKRLFSFAEAVDSAGQGVRAGDRPLAWGGTNMMCTRPTRFELYEHLDCAGRGLNTTGFAAIELTGGRGTTIRFK